MTEDLMIPEEDTKLARCPKCHKAYHVDKFRELKDRVECPNCKQTVVLEYHEAASDMKLRERQYIEVIKSTGLLYTRMNGTNRRIRVDLPKKVMELLKMRDNYRSVTVYINAMKVPRQGMYSASRVDIAEIDDELKEK